MAVRNQANFIVLPNERGDLNQFRDVLLRQRIDALGQSLQRLIGKQQIPQPHRVQVSLAGVPADQRFEQSRPEFVEFPRRIQVQFAAHAMDSDVGRDFDIAASLVTAAFLSKPNLSQVSNTRLSTSVCGYRT
jgi:hypothetical protein